MAFDITAKHPLYEEFEPAWRLMRDAFDGEDEIKQRGTDYLPMKSGHSAIADMSKRNAAYDAYKMRAEFPEIVAPTIRGLVGTMLVEAATVELPDAMKPLLERSTRSGMPLDMLHFIVATEIMTTGRYGILPGLTPDGTPYLAGYSTESIINWDATDEVVDYVVLDESGSARDRDTGAWGKVERYLELSVPDRAYEARQWVKSTTGLAPDNPVAALMPPRLGQRAPLGKIPFVFINTNSLLPDPDDIPLYGLAKIAARIYRMDADYSFALHMTSEPTPVCIGFDDAASAVKDGLAPTSIGSSKLWLLPMGGDAKFLEFSGAGLSAQKDAIQASLDRAVALGAQVLAEKSRTAESGDALSLRLGNQASVLKLIAKTTAAGLEQALRNLAEWTGSDPKQVKVNPNLDFMDGSLSAQEISAIVKGWQDGAYSWRSTFDRLQRGGVIPADRTAEEEEELIAEDDAKRGETGEDTPTIDPVSGRPIPAPRPAPLRN